ncbi:unnamed protein product [Brassicogethes aeneus]|uniref:Uncharacterized protein n=1 Tax=Brassicogethes aeneus TaxID=1431903 RepID=A0A9P0B4K6_BRAAE|nr:unnamed protein product [Brassicogethes aeneus]
MLNKCLIFLGIALAVQGGLITRNIKNIPVEVRYDDKPESSDSVKFLAPERLYAERNLDEKVQLSPSDLKEASKHIPVKEEIIPENLDVKNAIGGESSDFEKLGETNQVQLSSLIQKVQHYVVDSVKGWRKQLENEKHQPTPEQWETYEKKVQELFEAEKNKATLLKQDQNQNQISSIFVNMGNSIQNLTQQFISNVVGQTTNNNNGTQSDETNQNISQMFMQIMNNGVVNLQNQIGTVFGGGSNNSTNLSDTPAPSNPGNIISNFFDRVQSVFTGNQNVNINGNGTQGDEAGQNQQIGPIQSIQNFGGSINTAFNGFISQIIPQPQKPANASGDEAGAPTTTNNNPAQVFQGVSNLLGNFVNNFISGSNNQGQSPAEVGSTGGSIPNPIQQISNQVNEIAANNPLQPVQNAIAGGSDTKNPTEPAKEPVKDKPMQQEPEKNEPIKEPVLIIKAPKENPMKKPVKEEIMKPLNPIKETVKEEPIKPIKLEEPSTDKKEMMMTME